MFDIAVILINYNSSEHTLNCINSIIEKTSEKISYQIIVADNCSEKDDFLYLRDLCDKKKMSNIQVVRSNINTGFGGGNMFGAQYADASYLAFINNDTLLKNDCLSILLEALKANPSVGLAGGQTFNNDNKAYANFDYFPSLAKEVLGRNLMYAINKKHLPDRKTKYTQPVEVDFVSGSFMLIKSSDFFEAGGFDTNIFLYFEEADLCKRLKQKGKSTLLVPAAEFIHICAGSTSHASLILKKELKISLLYVLQKHSGYLPYILLLCYLRFRYFFSSIIKPRYWSLFYLFLIGAPLSKSLKQKQQIKPL